MSEVGGGFNAEKQQAIERMKELNSRSKYRQNTHSANMAHQNKNRSGANSKQSSQSFLSGFNIPFLSDIAADTDISLIIGLLLILISEKSDKLLLLALIYILM